MRQMYVFYLKNGNTIEIPLDDCKLTTDNGILTKIEWNNKKVESGDNKIAYVDIRDISAIIVRHP